MSRRVAAILFGPLLLTGCFLANTTGDDDGGGDAAFGPDASADGEPRDGSAPPDGDVECLSFGATRLCGEPCPLPCPWGSVCEPEVRQMCVDRLGDDPRGVEGCHANVRSGGDYCYSGRLCAVHEATFDPVERTFGQCVDKGYCEWIAEREVGIQCRYSEGHPYVVGPPDVPCGTGALPESGFCGGQCGDTCAVNVVFTDPPACVGISEERGFGVCVQYKFRCAPDLSPERTLEQCSRRVGTLGARGYDNTCACMLLSPPLLAEYAEHGWAVARQTCLAYKLHFPTQVRCFDETWTEL